MIAAAVLFVGRIPIVLAPPYDVDEGIYATIGQALNRGQLLYLDIWDNKPPAIYFLYAGLEHLTQDYQLFRITASLFLISAVGLFWLLLRRTLSEKRSLISLAIMTLLLTVPIFGTDTANAEIFFLPLTVGSILLTVLIEEKGWNRWWYVLVGGMLAAGFLFKVVVAFDGLAILTYLLLRDRRSMVIPLRNLAIGAAVIALPLLGYILGHGLWTEFINAAFAGNTSYVSAGSNGLVEVILKLVFLVAGLGFVYKYSRELDAATLIGVWFVWTLFGALLGGRPYLHYLIPAVPAAVWLVCFYPKNLSQLRWPPVLVLISVMLMLWLGFGQRVSEAATDRSINSLITGYYPNALSYLAGQKSYRDFTAWFGPQVTQNQAVSSYLDQFGRTRIVVWGSKPYIYYLSQDTPATKYVISYHVDQDKNGRQTFMNQITANPPDFVIMTNDPVVTATLGSPTPDFSDFLQYVYRYYTLKAKVSGADIYERKVYADAGTT